MRLLTIISVCAALWMAFYSLACFLPLQSPSRRLLLRFLAVLLAILIVGPEIGLGAQVFATLDLLGAEVFLASLIVGLRMLPG